MLIKINSETGEGMASWEGPGSLLAPSVDDEGFIYVGQVVGISPINVIDPTTFELTQQIELDGTPSYARGAVVTADGKGIWAGDLGGSGGPLYNWTSEDFITYTKTDSIYTNTDAEMIFTTQRTTIDWAPDGTMWVSHDNAYAAGDNSPNGFFVFDFADMDYCFVPSPEVEVGIGNGPRGIAFSVTGDTAYACSFNASKVWRYIKTEVSVEGETDVNSPEKYTLSQNYPNPFNPSTTIPFSIAKKGNVELKVYNSLGQEVKTLVNRTMTPGNYNILFNAKGLASGMYHYRLSVNGMVLRKQMILIK
jgi:DNA-binding beta-propeller fold protein YncE